MAARDERQAPRRLPEGILIYCERAGDVNLNDGRRALHDERNGVVAARRGEICELAVAGRVERSELRRCPNQLIGVGEGIVETKVVGADRGRARPRLNDRAAVGVVAVDNLPLPNETAV